MEFNQLFRKKFVVPESLPDECEWGKRGDLTSISIFRAFSIASIDEQWAAEWVLNAVHYGKPKCPCCGSVLAGEVAKRFWARRQCYCTTCRSKFLATTNTVLASTKLTFRQIFMIGFLLRLGVRSTDIAKSAECEIHAVSRWKKILIPK